jgi:hypothetical protein
VTIKRFHPFQVIHVPGALGLYRAESFAVGEQGCLSIDVSRERTCINVGLEVSGKRLIVQYSPIGVLIHDPHEQLPFADALLAMAPETELEVVAERETTKRSRKGGKP